jgi:hypothetical protein
MKQTIARQLGIKQFPFEIRDKQGNLIYKEKESGCWERREYNSQGELIFYEDSTELWEKREYCSEGKEIYFENSDGFWAKREWDTNGKQIYFENSKGTVVDDRPAPELKNKTIEIDGKKYKLIEL